MRIIVETDSNEEKQAPSKGPQSKGPQPQDVWGFGEIRETLWGNQSSAKAPRDVWGFPGIRKTLWGK